VSQKILISGTEMFGIFCQIEAVLNLRRLQANGRKLLDFIGFIVYHSG
tara:strand:- start:97 stop:240 length:144 start_codon:yes stop_codon:yes gene_type:complete